MLACEAPEAFRRSIYNGTASDRLCRRPLPLAACTLLLAALLLGGCSYRLASLTSTDGSDLSTGSIAGTPGSAGRSSHQSEPAQGDLAFAREAASNALAHADKDASVPWQNPRTGAGGNITPLDTAYSEDGLPCRDFLASYVHGSAQDWLQGAACRTSQGTWQVTRLTPLRPS